MAQLAPFEVRAVAKGAAKQRDGQYELALFLAWHMAVFNLQAKAGKLKPWSEIRRTFTGASDPPKVEDWRTRKAARKAQMDLLMKHQAQRHAPPRVKHAR